MAAPEQIVAEITQPCTCMMHGMSFLSLLDCGHIMQLQTGARGGNTVLIKTAQDRQSTARLPQIDMLSCIPLLLPWLEA